MLGAKNPTYDAGPSLSPPGRQLSSKKKNGSNRLARRRADGGFIHSLIFKGKITGYLRRRPKVSIPQENRIVMGQIIRYCFDILP